MFRIAKFCKLGSGQNLEWMLPSEPVCKTAADCKDLPNSICLQNPVNVEQKKMLLPSWVVSIFFKFICINKSMHI